MEVSDFGSDDWDIPGEGIRFELKLKMNVKEARFYFKGTGFQIIKFGRYVLVRGRAICPEKWIDYANRSFSGTMSVKGGFCVICICFS
jgi:hypothetical protein